ncbi:RHD3 [Scenedesmus sp. PABB004]|nr:RHD3 [Scenedesmus sp. PABB004]
MAAAAPDCCQVIDGEGNFQEAALEAFVAANGVVNARTNYQVVAIMGPQSSGKSTLMNHLVRRRAPRAGGGALRRGRGRVRRRAAAAAAVAATAARPPQFGTAFAEMDAMTGRQQTTKGVWLARSPKLPDPTTLILDLEGSDGRERGEDDTNFERQSALFALAVADVLLINVWCHDIGREQGSGKPLMKTIFQVNLKLFAPEPNRKRTVLLFVIRDKSKTPLAKLAEILGEDVHKMWDSISKPPQYADSRIDDFFEVQYTALPHYEDKYEDFIADSVVLRRRFTPDGDDSLVRAEEKLPADALVLSTRNIWSIIRSQKDLNLPAHKVMVASIRCNEIKQDQLRAFAGDQAWQGVEAGAGAGLIRDFGATVAGLLDSCINGYEVEAMYFDASVRGEHGADLRDKLVAAVAPAFGAQLRLLAAAQLAGFDKDFKLALLSKADGDEQSRGFSAAAAACTAEALAGFDARVGELLVPGTGLTADEARASLAASIAEHVDKAKHAALKEALAARELTLTRLVAVPAVELLASFPPNLWQQLHAVRKQAIATTSTELAAALSGMALTAEERGALDAKLAAAAEKKTADLLQEAALTRVTKMRDVFNHAFSLDEHGTPRTWRPKDNIPALARAARREAARVLALLAVVRGPDYAGGDGVEGAVMAMVRKDIDDGQAAPGSSSSSSSSASAAGASRSDGGAGGAGFELATATQWPGVAARDVLIAPHEARLAWREFMSASALSVQQAQVTQQANLMAGKRGAPIWALAAIAFLGWNEFMVVLWNPLYLVLGGLLFLLGYQVYGELDVDAELQRGPLLGLVAIWNKLGGVAGKVLAQNVELLQHLGSVASDMLQGQQGGDAPAPAFAGAGAGGEVQRSARAAHGSAAGLKQRGGDGVQMAQLRRGEGNGRPRRSSAMYGWGGVSATTQGYAAASAAAAQDEDVLSIDITSNRGLAPSTAEFFNSSLLSDVDLCADDGTVFKCHRLILIPWSAPLRRMLTGDMREARERSITLHGVDAEVLGAFLQFCYSCSCSVPTDRLVALTALADQYDVTLLQNLCLAAIRSHAPNHRCCAVFHRCAKEAQLADIQQLAWEHLASNLGSLVRQHAVFVELELEDVLRLCGGEEQQQQATDGAAADGGAGGDAAAAGAQAGASGRAAEQQRQQQGAAPRGASLGASLGGGQPRARSAGGGGPPRPEYLLFVALMAWLDHRPERAAHRELVLGCVDFGRMTNYELSQMRHDRHVCRDEALKELLLDAYAARCLATASQPAVLPHEPPGDGGAPVAVAREMLGLALPGDERGGGGERGAAAQPPLGDWFRGRRGLIEARPAQAVNYQHAWALERADRGDAAP